jgi:hypothetical protein
MMRASVKSDRATRVIELDLEADGAAWDLHDVTATWRKVPRIFRPDKARLVLEQGETDEGERRWEARSISISGYLVLKGGRVATNHQSRDSMTWEHTGTWRKESSVSLAPEWVQEIVRQAPIGITAYTWTDAERAEEVQAL